MKKNLRIQLNKFIPNPPQRRVIQALRNGAKVIAMLICRQTGKTEFAYKTVESVALDKKREYPTINISASTIKQARRLYGRRLERYMKKLKNWKWDAELGGYSFDRNFVVPEDKCFIDFAGNDGSDEGEKIGGGKRKGERGGTNDVVFCDEYGASVPDFALGTMAPTLDVKKGPLFVLGTPLGPNHYKTEFEYIERKMQLGDKKYFAIRWDINDSVRAGMKTEEEREMIESRYPAEKRYIYEAEYLLNWYAYSRGLVFAQELAVAEDFRNSESQITTLRPLFGMPYYCSWDVGVNGTCVWIWQYVNGRRHYLKYLENLEKTVFQDFLIKGFHPALKDLHLTDGVIYWPHDMVFSEFLTKDNRFDHARRLIPNAKHRVLKSVKNPTEAVNTARMRFRDCLFDYKGCRLGLKRLKAYKWNKAGTKIEKTEKEAKEASHGGDAFVLGLNSDILVSDKDRDLNAEFDAVHGSTHWVNETFGKPSKRLLKKKKKVFYVL